MRILHTADWHLGKRLDFFSRLEEQQEVLDEICSIAEAQEVDAVIVAGDLFDTFNPSVEAVELLYRTLRRLSNYGRRPVIAIAGNHDSADRIDAPDTLARECGIIFVGYPNAHIHPLHLENGFSILRSDKGFIEITLPQHSYPLRLLLTPYANEVRLKQALGIHDKTEQLNEVLQQSWQHLADTYCDKLGVNLLTAHLYMMQRGGEILEEPEGEKPIKIGNADLVYTDGIPAQIQYTALGHLHRYQHIGGHPHPVVYSSSPLCYSFGEAGQQKQVVIIDAKPDTPVYVEPIALRSGRTLHRKRFEDIDEAVTWLHAHPYTLVELTLISEQYLSSADLKRIHEAHDGIIYIIPIVHNKGGQEDASHSHINLDQPMEDLFKDFFMHRHGQSANTEILDLLKEVINYTPDTEA